MQRGIATGAIRLVPAAVATGAAAGGGSRQITTPRSGNTDEDWITLDSLGEQVAQAPFTPAEVGSAMHDLMTITMETRSAPIITEISDRDSDITDGAEADSFMASLDTYEPSSSMNTVISNLLSKPEVMDVVTKALVDDPEFKRMAESMGLLGVPFTATPLLLGGSPADKPSALVAILEIAGKKIEKALASMKVFVQNLLNGRFEPPSHFMKDGQVTPLTQLVVAIAAIILTKRILLKVV